jgi:hypothetical protein
MGGNKLMHIHFDNPTQYVESAIAHIKAGKTDHCHDGGEGAWGGPSLATLLQLVKTGGNGEHVAEAQAHLEKLDVALPDTATREYVPSVAGAYPDMGDFLAGAPDNMRNRQAVYTSSAPVRIGMVPSVSANVSASDFLLRGVIMLAILIKLINSGRTVQLDLVDIGDGSKDGTGETILTCSLPSSPISLSEAALYFCNLAVARRVPFIIAGAENNYHGSWPRAFDRDTFGVKYCAKLAERLGYQMILPPLYGNDRKKLRDDPITWAREKYAAILETINAED